jgi:hypothetical protein
MFAYSEIMTLTRGTPDWKLVADRMGNERTVESYRKRFARIIQPIRLKTDTDIAWTLDEVRNFCFYSMNITP